MVSGEHGHSLFGGVRQLILSPAIVGLLDPRVGPQHLYCIDVGMVERAHLLHIHLPHEESIGLWIDIKFWSNVIQIFIREMDNVLEETTVSKACLFLILGYNPGLGYGRVISSTVNICNYDVHWDSFNSSKITLQYTGNSTLESHWDIIEHSHLIKFMLFYSHTRGPIKWSFASKA